MLLEIYDIEPLKNFFDVIYDSASVVEMKLCDTFYSDEVK